MVVDHFVASSSGVVDMPNTSTLRPLFIRLIRMYTPYLLMAIPPPFPTLRNGGGLLPELRGRLSMHPITRHMNSRILILRGLLPIRIYRFTLFPNHMRLNSSTILAPTMLFVRLLMVLRRRLQILINRLARTHNEVGHQPLSTRFSIVSRPHGLLYILILSTTLPSLLLRTIRPLRRLEKGTRGNITIIRLLHIMPHQSYSNSTRVNYLIPRLLTPPNVGLIRSFLLTTIQSIPTRGFLTMSLMLINQGITTLTTRTITIHPVGRTLIRLFSFRFARNQPPTRPTRTHGREPTTIQTKQYAQYDPARTNRYPYGASTPPQD